MLLYGYIGCWRRTWRFCRSIYNRLSCPHINRPNKVYVLFDRFLWWMNILYVIFYPFAFTTSCLLPILGSSDAKGASRVVILPWNTIVYLSTSAVMGDNKLSCWMNINQLIICTWIVIKILTIAKSASYFAFHIAIAVITCMIIKANQSHSS